MLARLPDPHVVLLPTATVTTLLAANPYEGVRLVDLRVPLVSALSMAIFAWLVAGRLANEPRLRSTVATTVTLLLLLDGYLLGWLRTSALPVGPRALLEILLLVLIAFGIIRGIRKVSIRNQTARFLNVFGVLAIAIAIPALIRASGVPEVRLEDQTPLPQPTSVERPDIYLVLLDAYSGKRSLAHVYDFDNSPFLMALKKRGFAVPDTSRSNYVKTFLSIGSMMNRTYYERLIPPTGDIPSRGAYNWRMEFNRTIIDLKRLGYRFYYVGSSYPPLSTNRLADEQFAVRASTEFQEIYFRSTILRPLLELCAEYGSCRPSALPFQPETGSNTRRRIEYLLNLIPEPGPKFVYAHWLLPHGPFRLDAQCGQISSRWTIGSAPIEDDSTARRLYLDQLQCTNTQILRVVDEIRRRAGRDAVIILQSDHGHGRFPGEVPARLSESAPDQVIERFDVFAAYFGPDGLADSLAVNKTPVNTMRTLFRVLWRVNEAPLPDRYFWSEGNRPLHLVELNPEQLAVPATTRPLAR